MRDVLVVAPHPDDETLGCGGTLLRHRANGDRVHWLIATSMQADARVAPDRVREREREIERVATAYGIAATHRLDVAPARLDAVPLAELVEATSRVFEKVAPQIVYLPHPGDAHSDHRRAFEMCASACKWFRSPALEEVLAYETLSETGFGLGRDDFRPQCYVDIGDTLEAKLEILAIYASELGAFPFPRSVEAVRALAALRGTESGYTAAEAFQLLRSRR